MDIATLRATLLEAMLPHVPFDGWSAQSLKQAASDVGFTPVDVLRAFPEGEADALDYYMDTLDEAMIADLQSQPLATMRLHEKVRAALLARFHAAAPHREAVRRALAYYALPIHATAAAKRLYKTVDNIWKAAGDAPTDFSFYTKRMTLAAVYSSTLLFWLNDDSEGQKESERFLDRRLQDVLTFHKTKAKLKARFKSLSFGKI